MSCHPLCLSAASADHSIPHTTCPPGKKRGGGEGGREGRGEREGGREGLREGGREDVRQYIGNAICARKLDHDITSSPLSMMMVFSLSTVQSMSMWNRARRMLDVMLENT